MNLFNPVYYVGQRARHLDSGHFGTVVRVDSMTGWPAITLALSGVERGRFEVGPADNFEAVYDRVILPDKGDRARVTPTPHRHWFGVVTHRGYASDWSADTFVVRFDDGTEREFSKDKIEYFPRTKD